MNIGNAIAVDENEHEVSLKVQQYCTFFLGDLYLGVAVEDVQEVIRQQEMTPVPLSSPLVKGIVNLRGQIVTALDLRHRFGMSAYEKPPMNIVIRADDGPVSLLVDEIGDVVELDQSSYEATPETVDKLSAELVTGVFKLQGKLLLVLGLDKAIQVSEAA